MIVKFDIEKQFPTPRDIAMVIWQNAILCDQLGFRFEPIMIGLTTIKTVPKTIEEIERSVRYYYNIPYDLFHSKTRKREVVQARQIAMYFSKNLTKESLQTIGDKIGGKDHATVLHASKTVNNLIDSDKRFKHEIEEIERKL